MQTVKLRTNERDAVHYEQKELKEVSSLAATSGKVYRLPAKRRVPVVVIGQKGANERYTLRSRKSTKQELARGRGSQEGAVQDWGVGAKPGRGSVVGLMGEEVKERSLKTFRPNTRKRSTPSIE